MKCIICQALIENPSEFNLCSKCHHDLSSCVTNSQKHPDEKEANDNHYKIKFHIFVPPVFMLNEKENKCKFGIKSSYTDWDTYIPLKFERKIDDGYVYSATHEFNKNKIVQTSLKHHNTVLNSIEYKYVAILTNDSNEEIVLYEYQKFNRSISLKENREQNRVINRYDGIMLPPDDGYKKNSLWNKLTNTFYKMIKVFGSTDMIKTYKNSIINGMLYELMNYRESTEDLNFDVDKLTQYFKSVLANLRLTFTYNNYYDSYSRDNLETAFCKHLIDIALPKKQKIKPSRKTFLLALSILIFITNLKNEISNPRSIDYAILFEFIKISNDKELQSALEFTRQRKDTVKDLIELFKNQITIQKESINIIHLVLLVYFEQKNLFEEDTSLYNSPDFRKFESSLFTKISQIKNLIQYIDTFEKISPILFTLCLTNFIISNNQKIPKVYKIHQVLVFLSFRIYDVIDNNRAYYHTTSYKEIYENRTAKTALSKLFYEVLDEYINESESNEKNDRLVYLTCNHLFENLKYLRSLWQDNFLMIGSKFLRLLIFVNNRVWNHDFRDRFVKNAKEYFNLFNINEEYEFNEQWLTVWDFLLKNSDTTNDEIKEIIKTLIFNDFKFKIKNLNFMQIISICEKINSPSGNNYFHDYLTEIAYRELSNKIDKNIKNDEIAKALNITSKNQYLMRSLANKILHAKWPAQQNENQNTILSFLFENIHFIKIFFMIETSNDDYLQEKLIQSKSIITDLVEMLKNGRLRTKLIKDVYKHKQQFIDLALIFRLDIHSILKTQDDWGLQSLLRKTIEIRFAEMDASSEFIQLMKHTKQILCGIGQNKVNLNGLTNDLYKQNLLFSNGTLQEVINVLNIDEIIQMKLVGEAKKKFFYDRILNFDDFNRNNISIIKKLIAIPTKIILNHFIGINLTEYLMVTDYLLSIDDFLVKIVSKAFDKWNELAKSLIDGDLLFSELNVFLNLCKKEWKSELNELMSSKTNDKNLADLRFSQIETYLKINAISKIAHILMRIAHEKDLVGDFSNLSDMESVVKNANYDCKKIKDIDDRIFNLFSKLEKLSSDNKIKCLEAFVNNIRFVEWLRTQAKSLKDLKLLAEFASESENEGPLEVRRIQTLLLVGTAYAPLIYDLNQNSDENDLLQACERVCSSLDTNPGLADGMNAIAKEKSWLEDIKEAKGNTSASSLKQAIQINEKGEYIISLDSDDYFDKNYKIDLKNLIKLEVPIEKDNQISIKKYDFSEITDLQDKLTLVVGEEHQGVIKYFEDILESIIDLTIILIELLKSGNILFENWSLRVYCNKESTTTVKANFGLKNESSLKNIIGLRIYENDTVSSVHKIRDYLKDCYDEWIQHIDKKRNEYSLLNYFTIQQLTLLRTKLTLVNHFNLNTHNNIRYLTDILFNINPDCNLELMQKANIYAYDQVNHISTENGQNKTQEEDLNIIVDDLRSQGFLIDLIKEASQQNSRNNFNSIDEYKDSLLNYCYENEHKSTIVDSQSIISYESLRLESFFDDMVYEKESLEAKLQSVWSIFKQTLNKNLSNFLCLNHIGSFLNYLRNESKKPTIKRLKPTYIELNVPNIIVCEQHELYSRVLEIYSFSPDQPLPNDDEIMFCSDTTTAEDIEIFLKRVFFSKTNEEEKIYSIVNIHNLAYDQSIKVIYLYDQLTTLRHNFTLALFCAQEKEDKSILVTSFNRYYKKLTRKVNNQRIEMYLRNHLISKLESNVEKDGLSCRLIKSDRAATGKSLYIQRLYEKMLNNNHNSKYNCISVKSKELDIENIVRLLKMFDIEHPCLFHFDIAYEVLFNVDSFLFQLLCMSVIHSSNGELWRRSSKDLCLIEIMSPKIESKNIYLHSLLHILPSITCVTPVELFSTLQNGNSLAKDVYASFDDVILKSPLIQRPCQYLNALDINANLDTIYFNQYQLLDSLTCLRILLRHSEIQNPSWSELINFSKFLNIQLADCEQSIFCNLPEDLPGFKTFVIKFMIQMSHDFALPSLIISDKSSLQITNDDINFDIDQIQMRKKWEENPHPYLFFNPDGNTFTFLGFNVNASGQFINISSPNREIIHNNLNLSRHLMEAINRNARGILNEDISKMSKFDKISKILQVMGKSWAQNNQYDPDPTYELTLDNILKIMAIYMRFRCNIPVIIMGETGCGKTRLIRYLCDLQKNPNKHAKIENMYLVKVHGGLGTNDIINHVYNAIDLAKKNKKFDKDMFTILFFDEANSTEAIGTIKEVMCDQRLNGVFLDFNLFNLKIISACNPYKKHSQEIINKFKQAGLGFYEGLNNHDVYDKLGNLPMRELVYRVQPLPASMLPMIWDFGQLNNLVERLYISQIVDKYTINDNRLSKFKELLVNLLSLSQKFMREQRDECSFVSLRDVQRVLRVLQWFVNHRILFTNDDTHILNSIIHSFNACYLVSLQYSQTRENYRKELVSVLGQVFDNVDENYLVNEIDRLYKLFLDDIDLPDAIARNQALKENVFMIIICIELKIPLFVIGKPGSSKTLAKTLVAHKMQGSNKNEKNIFNHLKEAHLITFQCSPLSTSEMIIKTFRYCSKYQLERHADLDKYVSVVVLDEIGLAEASKSMPLKSLHPLLEDGVYFEPNEEASLSENIRNPNSEWRKIGFMGISNWVLDPAKMNRGIFVNRCSPDLNELKDIATGICKNDSSVIKIIDPYLKPLADGFVNICKKSQEKQREFFGLRDFYSLIKMIYYEIKLNKGLLDGNFFQKSIRRNFGGLPELNPLSLFLNEFDKCKLPISFDASQSSSIIELIRQALDRKNDHDNRYLLLIAQNENALDILKHYILNDVDGKDIKIIFGSSFPHDQSYSQICRQIHQIKLCMETGKTVILLNLETLYESLYDALNQFYYRFGDNEKFVDLGLGTQRVKCLVHDKFRLIVVSDKKNVYNSNKFPIPLVNRLEKHCLSMDLILDDKKLEIVREIKTWSNKICSITKLRIGDIFIGYTEDTVSSLVLKICNDNSFSCDDYYEWNENKQIIIDKTKEYLLQCATFNGIIQMDELLDLYFNKQAHNSFNQFIHKHQKDFPNFIQLTTHSKLLSKSDLPSSAYQIESLLAFNTKQQFEDMLRKYFIDNSKDCLIIQCDCGNFYQELINCTRFCIIEQFLKYSCKKSCIFIIQIPKILGGFFNGFQCNEWYCYHIDDLKDDLNFASIFKYKGKPLSEIFSDYEIKPSLLNILESSIYNICSKIIDLKANSGSSNQDKIVSIRRVETLINLFKKQELKFKELLFNKITILQRDKEEQLQSVNLYNNNWLTSKEVFNNIMKYGTLKQTCKVYIEDRISELAAGLIAYIDTNFNLDILIYDEQEWLIDLWLNLFNNEQFLNFNYSKYYAQPSNRNKNEFYCINSVNTRLRLPFSWLIKEFIDNLISPSIEEITNKKTLNIEDEFKINNSLIFNQLSNVFKESYQYQVLDDLLGLNTQKFVDSYIRDFLMLNQISNKQNEFFDVISNRLIYLIRNDFIKDLTKLDSLVAIHLSFIKAKNEIELLNKFIDKYPIIINIILTDSKYESNLCFTAAKHVFDQIIQLEKDMTVNRWNEWFNNVSNSSFLIESFMKTFYNLNQKFENFNEMDDNSNRETLKKFETIWEKVKVVKMLIENICKPQNDYYTWALRLWNFLKSPVDFKTISTIDAFFKFFQLTCRNIKTIYLKNQGKCSSCELADELNSINKCNCNLCDKCVTQLKSTLICPSCGFVYQQNELKLSQIDEYKKIKNDYLKLKASIDKFFIEIITYLAFNNNTSPNKDAIEYLVNRVIKQNELELSASVKLNLIRLLIKFNCDHYNAYESVEMSFFYIYAYEDYLFDNQENNLNEFLLMLDDLSYSIQALNTIEKLNNIAKIRYCLTRFAECLINFDSSNNILLEVAQKLDQFIQKINSQWPIFFLIKQIYRKLSKDSLISLSKVKELSWILPNYLRTDSLTNTPDSYVLFGNAYEEHRKEVTKAILCNKVEDLNLQKGIQNGIYCYLAMFKISNVSNLIETRRNECQFLPNILKKEYPQLESLHRIIEQLPSELVNQNKTLSLLMVYIISTILYSNNTLFESFRDLYNKPEKYAQQLFPTMPEDEDFSTFVNFSQTYNTEQFKFYACPNGHLYIIVDCTRPSQSARCKECNSPIGQKIGSSSYTLSDGNTLIDKIEDKTQKGYCLGEPINQPVRGIRSMNQFETLTMRIILTCILYMCSIKENNNIHYLTPNLTDRSNLNGFFLRHILNDLMLLSNYLQKSIDESILLIHYVLHNAQNHPVNITNPGWQSKESRLEFEVVFCNNYLKNININQVIADLTLKLKNDTQTDHLFDIAYEKVEPNEEQDGSTIDYLNNSNYWLFRNHISIENMKSTFHATKQNNLNVLFKFLDSIEKLETIKNLPLIVSMLNLIFILLNRQIDRQEAGKMTIRDLIDKMKLSNKSQEILINGTHAFSSAWKATKIMLKDVFIRTIDDIDFNNPLMDSNDYLNELPIVYYLSSTTKEGRYMYSLLYYLTQVQNEFLAFLRNELNTNDELKHIDISNITHSDCICFDIEKDLKQIININASYTQYSNIQYDFSSIQLAIIDQIIAKKSHIENKELFKFEFCDDISDIRKLKKLSDNVQQIELEHSIKDEINSFYKQPNQITNMLRILRIVFDFVVNSGCKSDMKIMKYAIDVLKMNITDTSDICTRIYDLDMKHLKSLWLSLSLYRAILLTDHGQDPFDRLSDIFKQDIKSDLSQDDLYDELIVKISKNKKFINKQKLKLLISVLYDLITSKLMVNSQTSDDSNEDRNTDNNFYANFNIADILIIVHDENDYLQNEDLQIDQFNLNEFKGEHAYLVWKLLVKLYLKKD